MKKKLDQAEQNAKSRDFDLEKLVFALQHGGIPQEEMDKALEVLGKATGNKQLFIGVKRTSQSRVRFAQFLQNNWEYLRQKGYFTSEEKVFLTDIQPRIGINSNAIVDDINKKSPLPLTQRELAKVLGTSETKISRVVNSLIKKGVLAKAESGVEGNNVKAYAIFVNPNIIISGDKEKPNETLVVMFKKTLRMAVLKELPEKLF
jgi:hypothetical protein